MPEDVFDTDDRYIVESEIPHHVESDFVGVAYSEEDDCVFRDPLFAGVQSFAKAIEENDLTTTDVFDSDVKEKVFMYDGGPAPDGSCGGVSVGPNGTVIAGGPFAPRMRVGLYDMPEIPPEDILKRERAMVCQLQSGDMVVDWNLYVLMRTFLYGRLSVRDATELAGRLAVHGESVFNSIVQFMDGARFAGEVDMSEAEVKLSSTSTEVDGVKLPDYIKQVSREG